MSHLNYRVFLNSESPRTVVVWDPDVSEDTVEVLKALSTSADAVQDPKAECFKANALYHDDNGNWLFLQGFFGVTATIAVMAAIRNQTGIDTSIPGLFVIGVLFVWIGKSRKKRERKRIQRYQEPLVCLIKSRNKYVVIQQELHPDAQFLFEEYFAGFSRVFDSTMHATIASGYNSGIDIQQIKVTLSAQQWEFVKSLRMYSDLCKKTPDKNQAISEHSARVFHAHKKAMNKARRELENQAIGMQAYAQRLQELEERHQEINMIASLERDQDALVELLSRVSVHGDMSSREISDLSNNVEVAICAYKEALNAAEEAAIAALVFPEQDEVQG